MHPNDFDQMKSLSVLIVGGGIGGLQAALALANDGHRVKLFESAKAFEEVRPHLINLSLFLQYCFTRVDALATGWRGNPHSAQFPQTQQILGRGLQ